MIKAARFCEVSVMFCTVRQDIPQEFIAFVEPLMVGRELLNSFTRTYELLRWETQYPGHPLCYRRHVPVNNWEHPKNGAIRLETIMLKYSRDLSGELEVH